MSAGSGKAARLGAYRKSDPGLNIDDSANGLSQGRRRTEAIRSPNNPYNFRDDEDDDMSATSPNLITMELDSKHAN